MDGNDDQHQHSTLHGTSKIAQVSKFLLEIIGQSQLQSQSKEEAGYTSLLSIPAFLSHGTDDAFVDVSLGHQAHRILTEIGLQAEWREYVGADNEGHWIKEPEGFDDIVKFLEKCVWGN